MTQATFMNAEFVVQPAGRERVRAEGKKNVHAFVRGSLLTDGSDYNVPYGAFRVVYNPYKYDSFMKEDPETGDLTPIYRANYAWVIGKTIYAI